MSNDSAMPAPVAPPADAPPLPAEAPPQASGPAAATYDSKTGVAVNVGLFAASLAIVATAAFRSGVYPAPVVIVALFVRK